MSATTITPTVESFSSQDTQFFRTLWRKELWGITCKYILLFALLAFAYYRLPSLIKLRDIDPESIKLAFALFFSFFSVSLLWFLFREYWSTLRPLKQEIQQAQKHSFSFIAHKYHDPIFKRCLLYYPDKDNVYISINEASFEQIEDGDMLTMEVSPITGTIMLLRSNRTRVPDAVVYRFQ